MRCPVASDCTLIMELAGCQELVLSCQTSVTSRMSTPYWLRSTIGMLNLSAYQQPTLYGECVLEIIFAVGLLNN
jgi:hypothetical protein